MLTYGDLKLKNVAELIQNQKNVLICVIFSEVFF